MTTTADHLEALRPILDPKGWAWELKERPRSRKIGAEIHAGATVVILVPKGARPDQVARFARVNLGKFAAHLATMPSEQPTFPTRELVTGEGFPLLGVNHKLRLVDNAPEAATATTVSSWSGGKIHELHVRRDSPENMRRAIIGWYQREGLAWAQRRGVEYESRADITAPDYRVRDLGKNRWGVYRVRKHQIELHWPLLQLPEELAMSTLVHELAHASRPGGKPHGPEWKRVMGRWMPDWRERQKEQTERGRSVWFGALAGE